MKQLVIFDIVEVHIADLGKITIPLKEKWAFDIRLLSLLSQHYKDRDNM